MTIFNKTLIVLDDFGLNKDSVAMLEQIIVNTDANREHKKIEWYMFTKAYPLYPNLREIISQYYESKMNPDASGKIFTDNDFDNAEDLQQLLYHQKNEAKKHLPMK